MTTSLRDALVTCIHEWIKDDVPTGVKMMLLPKHCTQLVEHIISAGLARGEWQDCYPFPKEGSRVLVWVDLEGLHVNDRSYQAIARAESTGFLLEGGSGYPLANVTHFQLLPPPPEVTRA